MDAVRVPLLVAAIVTLTAARNPTPPPLPSPAVAAPVAPSIKAGVEKWRAGDYPAAVAMWQPFANAGDPDALFNMGQAYKLGRGVPADPAQAREDYRKAALKGHLPAQANLGIALFQVGEKPEAIKWLRTAADRGEARAQYVLGIAAFNGDGLPRSQALGYGYLLRAQASGLPQAVTALGSIAPGLSPADRKAGEAVAASLAAGTGVPPAIAATSAPRLIASAPPSILKPLPTLPPPPTRTSPGADASVSKPFQTATQAAAPVSAPVRSMGVPAITPAPPPTRPAAPVAAPARPTTIPAPSDAARTATIAATKAVPPTQPKIAPPPRTGRVDATVMGEGEGGAAPARVDLTKPTAAAPSSTGLPPPTITPPAATPTLPAIAPAPGAATGPLSPIGTVAVPASKPVAAFGSPPEEPAKPLTQKANPASLSPPLASAGKPVIATPELSKRPPDAMTANPAANPAAKSVAKPQAASQPQAALKPFETVVPKPGAHAPTGWRVQLGAFSARRLADAAWADIKAVAPPGKPIFATEGPVTKLQMGPFATRDAAKAACAKLTAAGRACFVTQG